ncbi:MAG: hypothetical protein HYU73_06290 [Betaproteobacteria bacterium]|nr:hypothetical protein [Betaproteobacteria bacterium]
MNALLIGFAVLAAIGVFAYRPLAARAWTVGIAIGATTGAKLAPRRIIASSKHAGALQC